MAKLSATQETFLKCLFGPANGNLKAAAKATFGTEEYQDILTDELLDAIKKRADNQLTLNVPKAVFIMQKILDEPESFMFMDKLHKVAADILDRAGLSKKERGGNNTSVIGIVMLPNKMQLPEPPQVEPPTIDAKALLGFPA